MNPSPTPTLDHIAAHGNRGHHHGCSEQAYDLACNDGILLRIRAGNGTMSNPYVLPCDGHADEDWIPPQSDIVEHDYPGPYSEVEVSCATAALTEFIGLPALSAEIPFLMEVEQLREFIHHHGGEFNPVAEAETLLQHSSLVLS